MEVPAEGGHARLTDARVLPVAAHEARDAPAQRDVETCVGAGGLRDAPTSQSKQPQLELIADDKRMYRHVNLLEHVRPHVLEQVVAYSQSPNVREQEIERREILGLKIDEAHRRRRYVVHFTES